MKNRKLHRGASLGDALALAAGCVGGLAVLAWYAASFLTPPAAAVIGALR